ncbi:hypothetical protein [Microbacterium sp. K2]|uniref:hypothetical protein n=1 Tax=Microbacterium sp. K2 TaxID=3391827 RepID=UPI003EDB37C7
MDLKLSGRIIVITASHAAQITRRLNDVLGPTLVSTLAGSKDTRAAIRWAQQEGSGPDREAILRLECAEETWRKLTALEGYDVARLWFVGGNPWLHEDTVITAIREGRFEQVAVAVQALLDDSFSG